MHRRPAPAVRLAVCLAAVLALGAAIVPADAGAEWIAPRITLADIANVAEGDTLTMRAEPSPRAPAVGALPTWAGVDVNRCTRNPRVARPDPVWCHVSWGDGGSGWVNARYLVIHEGVHTHRE
jgi:uncharacterized protein YraI